MSSRSIKAISAPAQTMLGSPS